MTAGDKPEEGGMTSNHHAPYDLGYTYYNGWYNGKRSREVEPIL